MNKIKIILFGAADTMLQVANEHLRYDNCEIVAFCDNNEYKQGLVWNELPILSINQIKDTDYDFIIVGAWYSYNMIRENLLNAGIPDSKIMPLLSLKTIILLTEPIHTFSELILEKVFRSNPKTLNEKILELNAINERYLKAKPLETSEKPINFLDYPLIAHAGGGFLPDEKLIYTNSVEAFQHSIKSGFKMIEVDLWGIIDDDLIFSHDGEKIYRAATANYRLLTFKYILSKLEDDPDLKVMLDVKFSTHFDYKQLLNKMESLLQENYKLKQQFVLQTYNEETTEYAVNNDWQCVLMSYRNPEGSWFKKSACLCCDYNLLGAIFHVDTILRASKYLKFLKDKNIPILVYTTDDIEQYIKLKKLGVTSVITNFLIPRKI